MRLIPGDILYHICGATEDEEDRNIVNRKHCKNLNVLSMMGVCRSWKDQIRGLSGLFTDIAFDMNNHTTISTATEFLEIVEKQSSDLHVYARGTAWGVDPTVSTAFLSRLQLQSRRFVHFEAERLSPSFTAYFTFPAPKLLRLIHRRALPERLFSSSFMDLRVLDASVKNHFPWPTATLSKLVILRLENTHPTRSFCAASVFDLIGRAHQLGELRLTEFLRFSGSYEAKPLAHTNLKSIHFAQCNLKFILQHLQFPNATNLRIESYGSGLDGAPASPLSKDTGYFAPLQTRTIPILGQHSVTGVTIRTQDCFTNGVYFAVGLKCGADRTVNFTNTFRKEDDWAAYLQSSIDEILQLIRLGLWVNLSTFHYPPLSPINPPPCQPPLSLIDIPLLRLPQVVILRTDYSLVRSVVLKLANLNHETLPNLKCYSFDIETQPTPVDISAPEMVSCLRSRFRNGSPLALQYWTLNGEITSGWSFLQLLILDGLQKPTR